MHNFLRRTSHAAANRWRLLARTDDGFTIIEVVMSAAIVVLITGGVLTGIDAAGRSSADLRHRSQAQELAHQDQQRLRGMSALQLSGLDETRSATVDGTTFSVRSQGEFQNVTGGAGCGSDNAAYVKVVSTVDWPPLNKRPAVIVQSVITPPIGGTMIARVKDQNDLGLSGAAVSAEGPERFSGVTDTNGCAIFTAMAVGDYTVTASRAGYVDPDGNTSTSVTARATTSDTTVPQFKQLGLAGAVNATFTTRIDRPGSVCNTPPNYCTDQRATSLSWFNPGMAASKTRDMSSLQTAIRTAPGTALTLFPFASGGSYTNNYSIWAGRCDLAKPPPADISFATMNPGSTATSQVRLPALVVNVFYRTSASTTPVTPSHIKLTDACGQSWFPEVRPGAPTSPLGQLNYPGQPYASPTNRHTVCADYDPDGTGPASSYRTTPFSIFFPRTANDNFTAGTTLNLTIDSTSGWNVGMCPT